MRSSISGVVSAQLAQNQQFLAQNDNATIKKYVYIVSLSPQEKSFEVVALLAENNNVNTVRPDNRCYHMQGRHFI
ncbi:hypothetical protein DYY67_1429 [Candidatus Nitrosotalea sp. TS]|nr:hypothetical protein [Candidatus Nitrosotalea sp. TS]